MSDVLLMCTPARFICPLIYQLIDWLINRWKLMSLVWNRHGLSPSPLYLCPLIGVSTYPLIDFSENQRMGKLTLLSPINAHPLKRVYVSRILCSGTNKAINRSQCRSECVRLQNNWSHWYYMIIKLCPSGIGCQFQIQKCCSCQACRDFLARKGWSGWKCVVKSVTNPLFYYQKNQEIANCPLFNIHMLYTNS